MSILRIFRGPRNRILRTRILRTSGLRVNHLREWFAKSLGKPFRANRANWFARIGHPGPGHLLCLWAPTWGSRIAIADHIGSAIAPCTMHFSLPGPLQHRARDSWISALPAAKLRSTPQATCSKRAPKLQHYIPCRNDYITICRTITESMLERADAILPRTSLLDFHSFQTDSSNLSCKQSETRKLLEMISNSSQGLSCNIFSKFSELICGSIFWIR